MKIVNRKRMLALGVLIFTFGAVALYSAVATDAVVVANIKSQTVPGLSTVGLEGSPAIQKSTSRIDVVFVLDTTSSMGGMIQSAKDKIWSIASTLASAENTPKLRIGFIAFRDRGDAYITRRVPLSEDLDSAYAMLMDFRAEGGGDGPESVSRGLHQAVNTMAWSQHDSSYKAIFLVGDAPAHMDYQDEPGYPAVIQQARQKGIIVNSILCGQDVSAASQWKNIAQLGYGKYFQVKQDGGALAIATPYDEKIAMLAAKLDETRMSYGDQTDKAVYRAKMEASNKLKKSSSLAVQARRGLFNSSAGGEENLIGKKDLISDWEAGRMALNSLAEEELPAKIAALPKPAREDWLNKTGLKRKQLKKEIQALGKQRREYVEGELAKNGDNAASLDMQLWTTIREQAKEKGIRYSSAGPRY